MSLRERLTKETASPIMPAVRYDDAPNSQQGFQEMKSRLHQTVINRLDLSKINQLTQEQIQVEVARLAKEMIASEDAALSTGERDRLIEEVRHELFGLGPLEPLLADSTISDILVNSYKDVYIERRGKLERTN